MVVFNKYINKIDHNWYDSSNVVYSACFDTDSNLKTLKVVFKGGRTYLYRDVDANDYVAFSCEMDSTGSSLNKYIIKKYKGVRLNDTDLTKLEELKNELMEDNKTIEAPSKDLAYKLEMDNENGNFRLWRNNRPIFEGTEMKFSIVRLLRCMNIAYTTEPMETPLQTADSFAESELVQPKEQ